MPTLAAERVHKSYDRVTNVLEDVSLDVEAGEIVVVMGRSGSGKTTLLNLFAGLETPTSGRILVEDVDVAGLGEEARTALRLDRIGVVFQRFHLIPELTLEENVALPLQLGRRGNARARTGQLLQLLGLDHRADAFPSTLSGGESQRGAVARALANEPVALLADEPTANLDEENARTALDALRTAADELGTAVLVATHDPLVRTIGDRVLHIVDGRIATPERAPQGPA